MNDLEGALLRFRVVNANQDGVTLLFILRR